MRKNDLKLAEFSFYLIGLFVCIVLANDMIPDFCSTNGCMITKKFSIAGINLYWVGALFFATCFSLSVFKKFNMLGNLALTAIVVDSILLLVLLVLLPCTSCLLVGALIFGISTVLYFQKIITSNKIKTISSIWIILFAINIVFVGKSFVQPWAIYGNNNAEVKIYFSPTCEACKKAVIEAIESSPSNIALYPIAKNEKDYNLVNILACNIQQNHNPKECIENCLEEESQVKDNKTFDSLILAFNLFKNKLALLSMNVTEVPLVMTNEFFVAKNQEVPSFNMFGEPSEVKGCFINSENCN
jgi:hypothetical protein